ncbi:uncharacterized protein [Parasteatoda tepidariorum]|uniref:uncharacterized protein n=1 Tax=Parasteatoda tepidariorum TaxID=114398 RepID=UPI00077FB66D|nr:uncharacterized protein LOC107442338 [Parasteatoda tepidariorum]
MHLFWIILVFCAASVSAFEKKKVCAKLTEEIGAEFDKCNTLIPEEQLKLINECKKAAVPDALPENVDKTYPYLVEACKDRQKFKTFADCMGGHIENGKITEEHMAENERCYGEVEEKYDVGPGKPTKKSVLDLVIPDSL